MDASTAAKRAAERLLAGTPSPGERERAARLLEIAGDAGAAEAAWRETGQDLVASAEAALERGEAPEAVQALYDAAEALLSGKDAGGARRAADLALSEWNVFVAAKRIDAEPAAAAARGRGGKGPRLRRLPGGRKPEVVVAPDPAARPEAELPAMFMEMRARLLDIAGRAEEAEAARTRLMDAIGREVARRRKEQQWQEALEAARSWLRAALRAGGRARLDQVRPEFVSLAREAAAEAATPEYLARGHDEVAARAMGDALVEAHTMGNEAFAAKYEEELVLVHERTAEVLEALRNPRTAAEALLAAEREWTMVVARPGARERLLELSETHREFVGPMGLAGLARTHPLRAEVEEFGQRLEEVVARATRRAPQAYAQAAAAALPRDPARAQALAARGLSLVGADDGGGSAAGELLRALRAALAQLGQTEGAEAAHVRLLGTLAPDGDPEEHALRQELEDARFAWERDPGPQLAARAEAARRALAGFLRERGVARWEAGDSEGGPGDIEEAERLGDEEAGRWTGVLGLAPRR
ncbi:MAG TPA: hypothetical protein VGB42_06895 [Candidatus Thermoplasmatota archaeon]